MTSKIRRAGARWRILVHEMTGRGGNGDSYHVGSGPKRTDTVIEHGGREYWARHVVYPGTEFDELVVGQWIHIEQMDTGYWWMNIGGVTVHVKADRDGRPKHVTVRGPEDYAAAVEGCEYELVWRRDGDA